MYSISSFYIRVFENILMELYKCKINYIGDILENKMFLQNMKDILLFFSFFCIIVLIWKSSCDGSSRPLDHPADYYDFHVKTSILDRNFEYFFMRVWKKVFPFVTYLLLLAV